MPFARLALVTAAALLLGVTPASAQSDFDRDGALPPADCDPLDASVHPGAPDRPDANFADTNCDGIDGDKGHAIFVWRSGGDDVSPGTLTSPVKTIAKAVALASAAGRDVYVISDTYPESVAPADGVGLYGGYAADGTRSRANTTVIQGAPAVLADGDTGVVLALLTLDGVPDGARSAYGVRAINGSSVVLSEVTARARDGAPGANGGTGAQGAKGANGTAGGGAAGQACDSGDGGDAGDAHGGDGGAGRSGDRFPGFDGDPGDAVAGSGATAGAGGTAMRRPGGEGTNATAAVAAGTPVAAPAALPTGPAWAPLDGGTGAVGFPGGGGGGGMGGRGAVDPGSEPEPACGGGGGGGGAGGLGGRPGQPGRGGGGSFGAYVSDSTLTAVASTLAAGKGGSGGNGGAGGPGGTGGAFGAGGDSDCTPQPDSVCGQTGADGGGGGTGGGGGASAGGLGGPSAGVYQAGTNSGFAALAGTVLSAAGGGIGGAGPNIARSGTGPSGARLRTPTAPDTSSGDFDGDHVPDAQDACPDEPAAGGCPQRPARLPDADGDGVPDNADACPAQSAGAADGNEDGCPDVVVVTPGGSGAAGPSATGPGPTGPGPATVRTVSVRFDWSGAWTRTRTRFTRLLVSAVPKGTTIRLACRGRGCPKAFKKTFKHRTRRFDLTPRVKRARLHVGAVLDLVFTARGARGTGVRFVIRAGKRPKTSQLCVPPGGSRAQRC